MHVDADRVDVLETALRVAVLRLDPRRSTVRTVHVHPQTEPASCESFSTGSLLGNLTDAGDIVVSTRRRRSASGVHEEGDEAASQVLRQSSQGRLR